jgi:ABC-type multidrug transport system fused ATPase/permease subunit
VVVVTFSVFAIITIIVIMIIFIVIDVFTIVIIIIIISGSLIFIITLIILIISGDSVATAPTEGPDLGYDSINNHGVENTCINDELNEIENNDLRISQIIRTHTISSISCGDFHSAAISHCQRLYTWGSTAQVLK